MHIGSFLPTGANVLSSWFERQADNAVFTAEEICGSGAGLLTVTVWHKNREDSGPGTEITTGWTSLATGFKSLQVDGLKELIRFEYTVGGGEGSWVIYRMLQPTWFDTRNA